MKIRLYQKQPQNLVLYKFLKIQICEKCFKNCPTMEKASFSHENMSTSEKKVKRQFPLVLTTLLT